MERDFAPSDSNFSSTFMECLSDVHSELDIELFASDHLVAEFSANLLCIAHVVNRRTIARSQKFICHIFADDRIVTSAMFEQEHACCNFAIAKK